jgi:alpha-tubulin suppressor-like RCC1 family protein
VLGDTSLKGVNGVKAKSKTELLELGINKVVKVVSGINFTLALNDEGKVFVWGNNTFGQLGTGGLRNVD